MITPAALSLALLAAAIINHGLSYRPGRRALGYEGRVRREFWLGTFPLFIGGVGMMAVAFFSGLQSFFG